MICRENNCEDLIVCYRLSVKMHGFSGFCFSTCGQIPARGINLQKEDLIKFAYKDFSA